MELETLVAKLQKASWAYYNTDTPIMTDDEFDAGLEELRSLSPAHPFLSVIGAPPTKSQKGVVVLPYTMASLDKVRFGEEGLVRWLRRWESEELLVIMEKLDGLSALLCCDNAGKQRLYLRGDGVKGVDVSAACKSLRIPRVPCVIRGEILLPTAATPEGSIGRSLVNGWLHRLTGGVVPEELKTCHFVAYQVLEPAGLTRQEQLVWLKKRGFRIPNVSSVLVHCMNNECAKELLLFKKEKSPYPLDGIVLGIDRIPLTPKGGEAKNPEDAVAFKAALDEQKAHTKIVAIEWNLSRQNIYIPRIQIQPVIIGGARIEWLSGHNAALVQENGLGPGAEIIIRRSGDVIPTLDSVVKKVTPSLPSADWEWDATNTHAKRKDTSEESDEALQKSLTHALQTLEVEGIGPGLVKKLVEAKLVSVKKILDADTSILAAAIGAGRAPQLQENLRKNSTTASQLTLLIASNQLPRGIGEKKLRSLYAIESDASKWSLAVLSNAKGWTSESLETLLRALPNVLEWITSNFGTLKPTTTTPPMTVVDAGAKKVCFTGCRMKELPAGWVEVDSVTKQCNLLVIADSAKDKESVKTKKAKELGVMIKTLSEFAQ